MGIKIKTLPKQGFSLIQVSMLVAVAGIILASVLPGGEQGSTNEKDLITKDKMEKIEEATRNFMAANLRRPCPASGTVAIGAASFGVEDGNPGRCSGTDFYTQATPLVKTGGTSAANSPVVTGLSDTTGLSIGMLVTAPSNIDTDSHIASIDSASQITLNKIATGAGATGNLTFTTVAAGVVPTKTLGLPDDYMFDGYGRRIGYMVDIRATDRTTCRDMWVTKTPGNIQIMDSSSSASSTDNVMWSLISYGKNGHGAFPMQGSSIANRLNSGATNDDEEINAFVNTAGTFATAFTQKLVKHEPITTAGSTYFDDFVWTNESTKNTCCTGKMCNLGTRIAGTAAEPIASETNTGDINGDGFTDLIISQPSQTKVRIIFGRATGWTPEGSLSVGTPNSNRFITITDDSGLAKFLSSNQGGYSIAVGDINGDGYDDIVMGNGNGTNSFIKVFYGSADPASSYGAVNGVIKTSSITDKVTFPTTSSSNAPSVAIGNFASTTHKDILVLVRSAVGAGLSTAYLIYGISSPFAITTDTTAYLRAATTGFKINTTSTTLEKIFAKAGDVNGDGYDDIILSNPTNTSMYVLFGKSPAAWGADISGTPCLNNGASVSCGTAGGGATPDIINIDTEYGVGTSAGATPTHAVKFSNGAASFAAGSIRVDDYNGDGYGDILAINGNYFNVYYGRAAVSWADVDISNANAYNGTNGFRVDVATTRPAWSSGPIPSAKEGDVNGDGKIDLIFTDWSSDKNGADSGSSYVLLQPAAGWSSIWTAGTITLFAQAFDAAGNGLPLNNDVTKGFRIDGAYANDQANTQNFVDINGDGKPDVIISETDNASSADTGDIYIYFGKTLVPWDASNNISQLNRF